MLLLSRHNPHAHPIFSQTLRLHDAVLDLLTLLHASQRHPITSQAFNLVTLDEVGGGRTSSLSFVFLCGESLSNTPDLSSPQLGKFGRRSQACPAQPLHLQTCLPTGAFRTALLSPGGDGSPCRRPRRLSVTACLQEVTWD